MHYTSYTARTMPRWIVERFNGINFEERNYRAYLYFAKNLPIHIFDKWGYAEVDEKEVLIISTKGIASEDLRSAESIAKQLNSICYLNGFSHLANPNYLSLVFAEYQSPVAYFGNAIVKSMRQRIRQGK